MRDFLIASSLLATCAAAQPTNVRTDYAESPILVDNPFPRFSWNNDLPQLAYRVFVSASPSLFPLVWDSGVVESSVTSQVAYAGRVLVSDTTYTLVISSETAAGWANASASSFGTGLLAPESWAGAAWIGGFNQLRGTFSLPAGEVSRARVYVTGVGCAELWVNGQRRGGKLFITPALARSFHRACFITLSTLRRCCSRAAKTWLACAWGSASMDVSSYARRWTKKRTPTKSAHAP